MSSLRSFFCSWFFSPLIFATGLLLLVGTWCVVEPCTLIVFFDQKGYSPFELATIPFFLASVPLVWLRCPFTGSRLRRLVLCSAISCVALMAVVKELDLHLWLMASLYPHLVDAQGSLVGLLRTNGKPLTGTPFKMRFLLHPNVPFFAKVVVGGYFVAFFGVFATTLLYFTKKFLKGVFHLHPVSWSVGCLGVAGLLVQFMDRLPAWYRHTAGLAKTDLPLSFTALMTVLEEGSEMLLACFGLFAIYQGFLLKKETRS